MHHVFFIAQDAALLAHPAVTLKHRLTSASWVKCDAEDLATLAKRRGKRAFRSSLPRGEASFFAWPVLAPAMVSVALGTAVFPLVFPAVFRAVFHAKLLAACRILANQWFVVRTLSATETMPLGQPARRCLKLSAAATIEANANNSCAACQSRALRGTKLLATAFTRKDCIAMFAFVKMPFGIPGLVILPPTFLVSGLTAIALLLFGATPAGR